MNEIKRKINETKSLVELCELLNNTDNYLIDLSDLPVFSDKLIDDTEEIFSWDDTHYLVYDNKWEIKKFCETCGTAHFHCEC